MPKLSQSVHYKPIKGPIFLEVTDATMSMYPNIYQIARKSRQEIKDVG